jgi:hypothetical protein
MLQHLKEVYGDCRETISRAFQDEFLDLNDRLSSCYNDLTLALNINSTSSFDVTAVAANMCAHLIHPPDAPI